MRRVVSASCHLLPVAFFLLPLLTGCESLQQKFVRKPKAYVRPSPIINFQDYTRAMTPLDRYRKHYVLFDYWNSELIGAFEGQGTSAKRVKHTSSEALQELRTLGSLLQDDAATPINRMVEERQRLNEEIQRGDGAPSQADLIRRTLERQTRDLHRDFSWRKVEDRLKSEAPMPSAPTAETTTTHDAAH